MAVDAVKDSASVPEIPYAAEVTLLQSLLQDEARLADKLFKLVPEGEVHPQVVLFGKFTATSLSVWRLLPKGDSPIEGQPADIPSIASLIRNALENYNAMFFLCIDDIPPLEKHFRNLVMYHYSLLEQLRIGGGLSVSAPELEAHRASIAAHRREIEAHPFFATLPTAKQKLATAGRQGSYLSRAEIAERHGADPALLGALYRVMSNHTHSSPYGLAITFGRGKYMLDSAASRHDLAGLLYFFNYYVGLAITGMLRPYAEARDAVDSLTLERCAKLVGRFSSGRS